MTYDVGNPNHGLGQAQNMVGLNRLVGGLPTLSLLITGSPTAIQLQKQTIKIACIYSLPLKKTT